MTVINLEGMEQDLVERKKQELIQRLLAIKESWIELQKEEEEVLKMQQVNEEELVLMKMKVKKEERQKLIWQGLDE